MLHYFPHRSRHIGTAAVFAVLLGLFVSGMALAEGLAGQGLLAVDLQPADELPCHSAGNGPASPDKPPCPEAKVVCLQLPALTSSYPSVFPLPARGATGRYRLVPLPEHSEPPLRPPQSA